MLPVDKSVDPACEQIVQSNKVLQANQHCTSEPHTYGSEKNKVWLKTNILLGREGQKNLKKNNQ